MRAMPAAFDAIATAEHIRSQAKRAMREAMARAQIAQIAQPPEMKLIPPVRPMPSRGGR